MTAIKEAMEKAGIQTNVALLYTVAADAIRQYGSPRSALRWFVDEIRDAKTLMTALHSREETEAVAIEYLERILFKRLGLAPFEGKAFSRWRLEGGLSSEEWKSGGYAPRRRAEIHACIGEPLFRQQTMVTGPYRVAYDERRAKMAAQFPDRKKAHLHNDALRIMTKQLVSDLWSEWHRPNGWLNAKIRLAESHSDQNPTSALEVNP